MATNTENLGLIKPTQEDFYNVDDFNQNFQKIDNFLGRKDNPHGVTAEQVGAAPSGFGLGTYITYAEDVNEITLTGFYYSNVNTPDGVWSYINHYQYPTTGYAFQSSYSTDTKIHCTRCCENGIWGEWEYENPPMIPGVEYRTTKRHNKKPVYTKLINFGFLSNQYGEGEATQTKSIETGITGHIVSLKGTAMSVINNKTCYDVFPVINVAGKLMAITYTRESQLYVTTYEDCSGATAEFIIEYTK